MRILLQSRTNLFSKFGGDTRQVVGLRCRLRQSGNHVDVDTSLQPSLKRCDLVHLFGIVRMDETYAQWLNCRKHGVPAVVTPCHQDLRLYNRKGRYGMARLAVAAVGWRPERLAILRYFWRACTVPTERQTLWCRRHLGIKRHRDELLSEASGLVFASAAEEHAVRQLLPHAPSGLCAIIPTAIDPPAKRIRHMFERRFGLRDFVLCVGRIEDLKNQLSLLRALAGTGLTVVLAGQFNAAHGGYIRAVRRALRTNPSAHHVGFIEGDMLWSCYGAAHVHVQPSWFENVGLSTLEAMATGTPAVATTAGYGREYFKDAVEYCSPGSAGSIRDAVKRAMERGHGDTNKAREFVADCTWERVVPRYISLYEDVLDGSQRG